MGAFLALAIASVAGGTAETIRAANIGMQLVGWYALVPLALASLATGVVQSLASKWGLFRHYWVVFKLGITTFATVILLLYTETLDYAGDAARAPGTDLGLLQSPSPVIHSAIASLLLLAATVLAVFKPRGLTRFGRVRAVRRDS